MSALLAAADASAGNDVLISFKTGAIAEMVTTTLRIARLYFVFALLICYLVEWVGKSPDAPRDYAGCTWRSQPQGPQVSGSDGSKTGSPGQTASRGASQALLLAPVAESSVATVAKTLGCAAAFEACALVGIIAVGIPAVVQDAKNVGSNPPSPVATEPSTGAPLGEQPTAPAAQPEAGGAGSMSRGPRDPGTAGGPKPSPKFETPTNPPQDPPTILPPGHSVRVMGPTAQYPNGYWVQTNEHGQPVDPSTNKPPSNVTQAQSRAQTHVPLPAK